MIIRSKAPLRLGLAGGGTDVSPYSNEFGGYVLNATINMHSYCTIEETDNGNITFEAIDRNEKYETNIKSYIELDGLLDLHKGVYNRIVKDFNRGEPLPAFKMTTFSEAPAGSGLGSSSTMVVAILNAYVEWLKLPLGEYDIANLAYKIERIDIGLSGGKQDQYAATFGGFNFMEFYEKDRVIVNPLRIKNWIKNELEHRMLLFYTGTSRDSAKIIDEQVKNATKKDNRSIEGMHELKKNALIMKEAVLKGDFELFTECLGNGWNAKKKTASVISNPLIEEIYEEAIKNGAKAGKISGAGGGGFMMFVIDPLKRIQIKKALKKYEGNVMEFSFSDKGIEAWTLNDK